MMICDLCWMQVECKRARCATPICCNSGNSTRRAALRTLSATTCCESGKRRRTGTTRLRSFATRADWSILRRRCVCFTVDRTWRVSHTFRAWKTWLPRSVPALSLRKGWCRCAQFATSRSPSATKYSARSTMWLWHAHCSPARRDISSIRSKRSSRHPAHPVPTLKANSAHSCCATFVTTWLLPTP